MHLWITEVQLKFYFLTNKKQYRDLYFRKINLTAMCKTVKKTSGSRKPRKQEAVKYELEIISRERKKIQDANYS